MRLMLMLLLKAKERWFALPGLAVERILPNCKLLQVEGAPPFVSGAVNLKSGALLVVDFTYLISKVPSSDQMHTRLIVIGTDKMHPQFCLLAEQVTTTVQLKQSDFKSPKIRIEEHPFVDGIYTAEDEVIHLINVKELERYLAPLIEGEASYDRK